MNIHRITQIEITIPTIIPPKKNNIPFDTILFQFKVIIIYIRVIQIISPNSKCNVQYFLMFNIIEQY